jgi:translocation and assembly module TamB
VSGRIDLLSGRYYKRFNLAKTLFGERQVAAARDRFESEFFKDWRWNVEVRNSGDLRIENNMATVFLDGNLRLKGSTQRPVILGVVTSSGGELHYLGRNLQITEGSLDFRNPNRINPYVNFQAQREVEGAEGRGLRSYYTVHVKVEGPLDNMETTLWSTPAVDKADVISLLAFGVRQSDLRGTGASRRAFATTAIANSLTSGFGADLGDIVGLDILRFESGEGSDQAISGVALGKNLSDRLSVEFYTDISPDLAQRRVRSKYYLSDNLLLEGANTFEGDRNKFELNVSLQFKIR